MYSHQRPRAARLEFYFVTDFESSVNVAISGVDYVPEMLTLYSRAVDEAKRLVGSSDNLQNNNQKVGIVFSVPFFGGTKLIIIFFCFENRNNNSSLVFISSCF